MGKRERRRSFSSMSACMLHYARKNPLPLWISLQSQSPFSERDNLKVTLWGIYWPRPPSLIRQTRSSRAGNEGGGRVIWSGYHPWTRRSLGNPNFNPALPVLSRGRSTLYVRACVYACGTHLLYLAVDPLPSDEHGGGLGVWNLEVNRRQVQLRRSNRRETNYKYKRRNLLRNELQVQTPKLGSKWTTSTNIATGSKRNKR